MKAAITISPYDPDWPKAFELIRRDLNLILDGIPHRIEHIGSTSVPGLAAKSKIDLDILVETRAIKEQCLNRLKSADFTLRGDAGITGRESILSPPEYLAKWMDHNLYCCLDGIPAVQNHIGLRDFLRNNQETALAYGKLKLELAAKFPYEPELYTDGKTKFIISILKKIGLAASDLLDIEDQNKP